MLVTTLAVCVLFGTIDEMRRECFVGFEVHVAGTAYIVPSRVCSVLVQGLRGIEDGQTTVTILVVFRVHPMLTKSTVVPEVSGASAASKHVLFAWA